MSGLLRPATLDAALSALGDDPELTVLAGGTDLMVAVNYGQRRPTAVLSLRRLDELTGWRGDGDDVVLGSRLTYAEMQHGELAELLPGLAQAARTVGSPQIRATGTIGGNLGTASPAGDTLPVLAAYDATVEVASAADGHRRVPMAEFVVGPKRTTLRPGELITGVRIRVPHGPQEFLKIGPRNAMVIAVANCALVADRDTATVRCALGSVGPVPLRCVDAEAFVVDHLDWDAGRVDDPRTYETFGALCAEASRPIDDHRSTAEYRRHATGVLARRALMRAFRGGGA